MRRLFALLFPPRASSASVARERLKIVLAHERGNRDTPDFLPMLQQEVLEVVRRYLEITPEMIRVNVGRSGETSTLEINVEIDRAKARPVPVAAAAKAAPAAAEPAAGSARSAPAPAKPAVAAEVKPTAKPAESRPAVVSVFDSGEPAPWVKPG